MSFSSVRERTPRCRMRIVVEMLSGKTIPLDVKASDEIRTCKWQVYAGEGIHPNQQRLIFDEQDLDDGRKIADYNIQPESTLSLIVGGLMEIYIQPPVTRDHRYTLVVQADESIDSVRSFVSWYYAMVEDNPGLRYAGQWLENGRTLSFYDIQYGSVIHWSMPAFAGEELDICRVPEVNEYIDYHDTEFVLRMGRSRNKHMQQSLLRSQSLLWVQRSHSLLKLIAIRIVIGTDSEGIHMQQSL